MIEAGTATRGSTRRRVPDDRWPLVAAGVGALAVAVALGSGHLMLAALAAALPLIAVSTAGGLSRLSQVPIKGRMVGVVCVLLLSSTFVWRARSTQQLDNNPLDSAAILRVGLVSLAALVAFVILLSPAYVARRIPTPLRFLGGYIVVAALTALNSPLPLQALYRAFELGAGFLAVLVTLALLGDQAGTVVMRVSMIAIGTLVSVIWIEALLFPSGAWESINSVVPYQLQGYLPSYSTNAVGTFGALLAIWGVARTGTGRHRVLIANATLALGVLTLLAAQYRTGIIGFLVAGGLVAWYRRRGLFVVLLAGLALFVMYVGVSQLRAQTLTVFAKGRPELVSNLDSRTVYWHAAMPLIRERPLLGWGLNVASRQVLVSLGDNSTSSIHSTWVEALLGTGLIGAGLLALAFLTSLRSAWHARGHPVGIALVGMIVFLIIRSLTGPTVELFDILFLIFAAIAFAATQLSEARDPEPVDAGSRGIRR